MTKVRYWLLPFAITILALLGYAGYLLYPRFGLPAFAGVSMILLSATAGMASFFSPCSFPLLVTLLARHAGIDGVASKSPSITRNTFSFAIALSLGTALFLLLAGLIISLTGEALFERVVFDSPTGKFIRGIVGILLLILGLMQLGVLPISLHLVERISRPMLRSGSQLRSTNPFLGFVLFGFGYLLAGFGWTGPILAGLAGHAFILGGFGAAMLAFVVAALMIVILMFLLAYTIATAQNYIVGVVKARIVDVKRWGGWILIVVGAWLLILAVFAEFFTGIFPV